MVRLLVVFTLLLGGCHFDSTQATIVVKLPSTIEGVEIPEIAVTLVGKN